MDQTCRPSKHTKFPPPFYLISKTSHSIYCHNCGRIINPRRTHNSKISNTPIKYCSDRCRSNKPGLLDRRAEEVFAALLDGKRETYLEKNGSKNISGREEVKREIYQKFSHQGKRKGDQRIIVWCSEVQALVFGQDISQIKQCNEKKCLASRDSVDENQGISQSMEEEFNLDSKTYPLQINAFPEVFNSPNRQIIDKNWNNYYLNHQNQQFSQSHFLAVSCYNLEVAQEQKVTGVEDIIQRRDQGQKWALEREIVKRAARRAVVFGLTVEDLCAQEEIEKPKQSKNRKNKKEVFQYKDVKNSDLEKPTKILKFCEAVMTEAAIVVEPSFAKGDWGIRWRV